MDYSSKSGSGEEQGSGSPPCLPATAVELTLTGGLVLTASRAQRKPAGGTCSPAVEVVPYRRMQERLAEIEQAGGLVRIMERKHRLGVWVLTVEWRKDGERKE